MSRHILRVVQIVKLKKCYYESKNEITKKNFFSILNSSILDSNEREVIFFWLIQVKLNFNRKNCLVSCSEASLKMCRLISCRRILVHKVIDIGNAVKNTKMIYLHNTLKLRENLLVRK